MNRHYDPHFKKEIITIHPGEFYTSKEDIYIATVLGSCISVALYDIRLGFGGMNHFMLPKSNRDQPLSSDDEGRFGNFAMELLINDMINNGSTKQNLRAKVFGGGNVLDMGEGQANSTGINNINFALKFLKQEGIPIIVNDTGGLFPRKIFFHPLTSKVYLKRIQKSGQSVEQIRNREYEYKIQLQNKKSEAGNIVWF
jgi:chemotaxis protein CheD